MKCSDCGHLLIHHAGMAGNGTGSSTCWAMVDRIGRPDNCGCQAGLPDGLAWTGINGRWPLILPTHRAERTEWPWWEATRLAAMHHHLSKRSDHVIYDIGSEEGDFPALWASWGAYVIMFEPNPRVWPNIRLIWEANNLVDRWRGAWVGFAAASGDDLPGGFFTHEIDEPAAWPPCADGPVIGDHGFLNLVERDDVRRVSIDTIASIDWPPSAITIDVEGAELEVLRGAEKTLAECRPAVWVSIHPEFMADMYGVADGVQMIRNFMARFDYEEQFLAIDHEHHWQFLPR